MTSILQYFQLPLTWQAQALEGMNRDSQRHSSISQNALRKVPIPTLTPKIKVILDEMCQMYGLPLIGQPCLLEATISCKKQNVMYNNNSNNNSNNWTRLVLWLVEACIKQFSILCCCYPMGLLFNLISCYLTECCTAGYRCIYGVCSKCILGIYQHLYWIFTLQATL